MKYEPPIKIIAKKMWIQRSASTSEFSIFLNSLRRFKSPYESSASSCKERSIQYINS